MENLKIGDYVVLVPTWSTTGEPHVSHSHGYVSVVENITLDYTYTRGEPYSLSSKLSPSGQMLFTLSEWLTARRIWKAKESVSSFEDGKSVLLDPRRIDIESFECLDRSACSWTANYLATAARSVLANKAKGEEIPHPNLKLTYIDPEKTYGVLLIKSKNPVLVEMVEDTTKNQYVTNEEVFEKTTDRTSNANRSLVNPCRTVVPLVDWLESAREEYLWSLIPERAETLENCQPFFAELRQPSEPHKCEKVSTRCSILENILDALGVGHLKSEELADKALKRLGVVHEAPTKAPLPTIDIGGNYCVGFLEGRKSVVFDWLEIRLLTEREGHYYGVVTCPDQRVDSRIKVPLTVWLASKRVTHLRSLIPKACQLTELKTFDALILKGMLFGHFIQSYAEADGDLLEEELKCLLNRIGVSYPSREDLDSQTLAVLGVSHGSGSGSNS